MIKMETQTKKRKKLFLAQNEIEILNGEAIINTLYSLIELKDLGYDENIIKRLIDKIKNL